MTELFGEAATSLAAEGVAELAIVGELKDRRGEVLDRPARQEDAGFGEDDLARPVDVVTDHGTLADQRLG